MDVSLLGGRAPTIDDENLRMKGAADELPLD